MKSAPWYRAASNASSVFYGKIEDNPLWAIFNGRLLATIYDAGFGSAEHNPSILTNVIMNAIVLSISKSNK